MVIWVLLAKLAVFTRTAPSPSVCGDHALTSCAGKGHSPHIAPQVSSSIKTSQSMTHVTHSLVTTDPKEHRMVGIKNAAQK